MVKMLLIVAMLFNANSQECIRASYVVEVWIKETAILPIAAKVPSPQTIATSPLKGEHSGFVIPFLLPPTEPSVGHIDQHDYG